MIQLSIALTVGLCLAAAGFAPVIHLKEKVGGRKTDMIDNYAF